jgi:photosystem II stability/assembly factor-like uncharacterized protein
MKNQARSFKRKFSVLRLALVICTVCSNAVAAPLLPWTTVGSSGTVDEAEGIG